MLSCKTKEEEDKHMARITVDNTTFEIPTSDSECPTWQIYFEELKKKWGKDFARKSWLKTWQKNKSLKCETSSVHIKWMQKNEVDSSNALTKSLANASDTANNISSLVKNTTGALAASPKIILYGSLAVGGLTLLLVFNMIRKSDLTIKDVAGLVPGANAMKLAGQLKG